MSHFINKGSEVVQLQSPSQDLETTFCDFKVRAHQRPLTSHTACESPTTEVSSGGAGVSTHTVGLNSCGPGLALSAQPAPPQGAALAEEVRKETRGGFCA